MSGSGLFLQKSKDQKKDDIQPECIMQGKVTIIHLR